MEVVNPAWETAAFWQELCPSMTVSTEAYAVKDDSYLIDADELQREKEYLHKEGYGHIPCVIPDAEVAKMAEAVKAALDATGFSVFALVYDEFWCSLARLSQAMESLLGEGFQVLPDVWAWYVQTSAEDAGWKPHRDRGKGTVLPDGTPLSLSVWLPLTDATPLNGCMYVVPASLDHRYHTFGKPGEDTSVNYQDIRAVPAKSGSVLFWSSQLLHWGGRSSARAQHPRVSVAFELQASELKPQAKPLLSPCEVPSFSVRLALVARQLLQYQHLVDVPPALSRRCRKWMQALPGRRSFLSVLSNLKR